MQRYAYLLLFICASISPAISQTKDDDPNKLYWSNTHKINLTDFMIHSDNTDEGKSSAIFEIEYGVKGFNFLRKNFNKKIVHYMLRSSSQIVIDDNMDTYVRYQQTIFDLEEVYVRLLRKAVSENRKKLIFTTGIINTLKSQIIDEELRNRQAIYTRETNAASNEAVQKEWEAKIVLELDELKDYSYDF